jgi:hypothetical protein
MTSPKEIKSKPAHASTLNETSTSKTASSVTNMRWIFTMVLIAIIASNWSSLQKHLKRQLSLAPSWKNVIVYDNGESVHGIRVAISVEHVNSTIGLATYLSQWKNVSALKGAPAIADRVYTGKGTLVTSYADIQEGDRLYLVAQGLHFVWPFVKVRRAKMQYTKAATCLF